MTKRRAISRLMLGTSVLLSCAVQAQESLPPADTTEGVAQVVAAAEAEAANSVDNIVVTGSRVIRNGNASPSPVTVVATEDLLAVQPGANLADALNILPVFAGSRGAGSNPSTAGSASGGNGSANQLNLRNLGIQRTLVLVDGVRIPPTLFNGSVDVDLIPQMLVQRVDVVTGGVSAVYGSDAVAGVVNYIIDKDFDGLRVEASSGISRYNDATQLDAGIAFGTSLGDRLHFEASYQYHSGGGILRRSDREWMQQVGVGGLGTAAAPYQLFDNLRQANFPAGGMICGGTNATTCLNNGRYFVSDGVLVPFVNGTPTGTAGLQVGGAGGTWDSSLLQPLDSHQVFGRLDFDVSDAVHAYAQVSATFKKNENFQEYPRLTYVQLRTDNPFLTTTLPGTTFRFSRTIESGPRINQVASSEQWFANAGLNGDLGSDWNWAVDYVYGRSLLDTEVRDNVNFQRLSAALDTVRVGNTISCYAATQAATAAQYADCVPLNPFGPTATSNAALDYITGTTNYSATTEMNDISGSLSGSLLDLWAGPLSVAVSGEWRKVSFVADSNATSSEFSDCTNLRYNCSANQITWFVTLSDQPKVSQTVWEVAGEFDLPILADSAIGSVNVNGAARYTSYNTSGEYVTWKAGVDWAITDTLRFRGTRSRDIRAPTLYDLFAERFVVSVQGTDLLTGQSPTIPSINGGNPDLTAEIGNTWTGGLVWRPAPGLSLAIDGYEIEVSDAILSVNGGEQGFQNACYDSGGTSPYCALQERPGGFERIPANQAPSNQWTAVYNGLFNISSIKTWGIDLEANYSDEVMATPFSLRLLASYQPDLSFAQPNVATRQQAGSAFGPVGFAATPEWRLVGFLRVEPSDGLKFDILQRWRSDMVLSGEEGPSQVWVNNHIDSFMTTTVNLAYELETEMGNAEVFLNVANLFDADPPIGAFYGNGTRAGLRDGYAVGDDARGRYFTVGVRISM